MRLATLRKTSTRVRRWVPTQSGPGTMGPKPLPRRKNLLWPQRCGNLSTREFALCDDRSIAAKARDSQQRPTECLAAEHDTGNFEDAQSAINGDMCRGGHSDDRQTRPDVDTEDRHNPTLNQTTEIRRSARSRSLASRLQSQSLEPQAKVTPSVIQLAVKGYFNHV